MRRRKSDLHARVNRNLPLEFDDVRLTSYAGLELLERYLRTRRFNQLVREAFADLPRWGDFGVVVMVRVFVGLVIVGGRRLRHLAYVADDPIFQRFGNVRVVPTARTLSRWLRHFTMRTVTRFPSPQRGRRAPAAAHAGAAHLDGRCGRRRRVDGVAGRTGGAGLQPAPAEGAQLLPDHGAPGRDDPHPAGQESVGQRPRWEGGPAVLAGPVAAAVSGCARAGPGCGFAWMGPFFRQDVLRWLQGRGVGYAIKVPFYRWLDLQRYIRNSPTWVPVAPGVTGFAVPGAETPWHIPVTVTIYRKKVHHRATKNYQLDLFDPNDGHYEYSAVTSNLALTVRNLWYFACGRGNHEKTIAQLKTGLAFHSVPTQTYAANSAWQQLVVLAHNLLTNFQLETGAPPRRRTRKHTVVPLLQSVQTLRFELFHRAALLVRPGGKTRLRMTDNLPTRQTFTRIANALASG